MLLLVKQLTTECTVSYKSELHLDGRQIALDYMDTIDTEELIKVSIVYMLLKLRVLTTECTVVTRLNFI